MASHGVFGDGIEADSAQRRRRSREVPVDQLARQPHRLEYLGTAVTLKRRDAHLGHDLEQALADGLHVQVDGCRCMRRVGTCRVRRGGDVCGADGLERERRIDGARAIAEQQRDLRDLTGLIRANDDAGVGPDPRADQVMMDGRYGEQRRERGPALVHRRIVDHEELRPSPHRRFCGRTKRLQRRSKSRCSTVCAKDGRKWRDRQATLLQESAERGWREHRLIETDDARVIRRRLEQIQPRTEDHPERHHQLLADRIDRGVRHLREQLAKIGEQRARPRGQRCDGRVVSHRADRLFTRERHGRENDVEILARVSERTLPRCERQRMRLRAPALIDLQQDALLGEPALIGMQSRQLILELVAVDQAALRRVHHQDGAGTQTPLGAHARWRDRKCARFGGQHHEVVIGHDVAPGTQPVTVQHRADVSAIGERDGGGTIPRLHQRAVIGEERAAVRRHRRVALPRFRDQHQHRMRERATAVHEQLERIVDRRRVALTRGDEREQVVDVRQARRLHPRLTHLHPLQVPLQCVDFAVVAQEAIRMRARPRRERVRREARVHQRQRGGDERIRQVGIEGAKH